MSRIKELSPTAVLDRTRPFLNWYQMPESFSAPLVEDAIGQYGLVPGQTILDPFSGAGTTVLTAKLHGLNGVGIEVNPFLCFAARIKVKFDYDDYDLDALETDINWVLSSAQPKLAQFDQVLPLFTIEATVREESDEYIADAPQMPRLFQWISLRVVKKVLALKETILQLECAEHQEFCLLALAAILRPVSNMKLTPHAFGSRKIKEDAPVFESFHAKVRKMLRDLLNVQSTPGLFGQTQIINADARQLQNVSSPFLPADLVVTSPPYLNNLDYTMQTRLELFFLDFIKDMKELRGLRKRMVASDAKAMYRDIHDHKLVQDFVSVRQIVERLEDRLKDKNWGWDYAFMTAQYFGGMLRALQSTQPLLKPGGYLLVVVGESAHSGIFVPVPEIIGEIGQSIGYTLDGIRVLRTRRSSSHKFKLTESIVALQRN